jgi:hypothetical protein
MRKRVTMLVMAFVVALMMSFGGAAFAKIQSVDISCTNAGGNQPGGRSPSGTEPVKGSFTRLGLIPEALAFLLSLCTGVPRRVILLTS